MAIKNFSRRRHGSEKRRALAALAFFFFCFSGLFLRIFVLQIVLGDSMRERADRQGRMDVELLPWRGTIYDRQMRELAISVSTDSLYLRPARVSDADELIPEVAGVLGIGTDEVRAKLESASPFVWLRRKVEHHKTETLRMLPGLGKIEESSRFYPGETLASHVIGFAGMDNYGLEGIEYLYDRYLTGAPGTLSSRRDARGRETVALRERRVDASEGHSIILSIDKLMQFIVEDEIDRIFTDEKNDPSGRIKVEGLSVIVMQPDTGRILALANRPSFSPASAGSFPAETRRNRAVTDVFEPGSSFKIVTAAAALEEGLFRPEHKIFCENGAYRVAGHTIRDVSRNEWLTFSEVIQKSSNIGMIKIGEELGNARLHEYVRRFGFGEKTGCDLPGEVDGLFRHPRSWSRLSNASISFGYEVGVSAIQLAAAYSAVANGGVLMRPSVVTAVLDNSGKVINEFTPEARRRVISPETASDLTMMLVEAVNKGTGTRARVPGYSIAGKTGTARKLDPEGGYSRTGYVSSFAGFAAASSPEVVVIVIIDEPDVTPSQAYGGSLAAPVFQGITSRILRYLGIPPEGAGVQMVDAGETRERDIPVSAGSAARTPDAGSYIQRAGYIVHEESSVLMPDVRGLSMREVLRALAPYGLKVKFHGSGSAERQRPAPGEKIEPGDPSVIVFSSR